jgi:hypothetical protein
VEVLRPKATSREDDDDEEEEEDEEGEGRGNLDLERVLVGLVTHYIFQ